MSASPQIQAAPSLPSFREIYREHATFLWRVLRRLGVPEADTEDVLQEVFLVAHRKLASFEHQSSLRTWLYGIAYRSASEYRRRPHVRREVATESPDLGSESAKQPGLLDQHRARQSLDRILAELDEHKRAVFVFYEIEELAMDEVAHIMMCPVQTAYSRLRAARTHVSAAAQRLALQEQQRC